MELIVSNKSLALRRLTKADLAQFQAYRNDPEVARYQSWAEMDDKAALRFLAAMETVPLLDPGAWSQIGIARPSDDLLVGDMGWFLSKDPGEAELGITLAQAFQRQGIATGAMRLAAAHVFSNSDVERIIAYADVRNEASCALMPSAGFTQIGTEVTDGVTEHLFELRRGD